MSCGGLGRVRARALLASTASIKLASVKLEQRPGHSVVSKKAIRRPLQVKLHSDSIYSSGRYHVLRHITVIESEHQGKHWHAFQWQ